jgi:hypothetical protein
MKKYYCDLCGEEIPSSKNSHLENEGQHIWDFALDEDKEYSRNNTYEICRSCIKEFNKVVKKFVKERKTNDNL